MLFAHVLLPPQKFQLIMLEFSRERSAPHVSSVYVAVRNFQFINVSVMKYRCCRTIVFVSLSLSASPLSLSLSHCKVEY